MVRGSLPTRFQTHRRSNQTNHTSHNNLARSIQAKCQAVVGFQRTESGPRSSAASPATSRWTPTSVGRLISNRSSRLAFQWLMMSASFLLSSSLLPDMVDSFSSPCPSVGEVFSKTSGNVSPLGVEKNAATESEWFRCAGNYLSPPIRQVSSRGSSDRPAV